MPTWVFPAAALLWAMGSTIVAWMFAVGKFAGRSVTVEQLDEKADCDRVTALERRVQGEHDERRRLVEVINAKLGTLQVEQGRDQERLNGLVEDVKELRRKVFNGGMAGV